MGIERELSYHNPRSTSVIHQIYDATCTLSKLGFCLLEFHVRIIHHHLPNRISLCLLNTLHNRNHNSLITHSLDHIHSKGITNLLGANLITDGDDVDGDGEPDHLVETRNKIDDYLAKQWLLGKRKLTVSVNYGNMPLEYQYLNQYHGFPNPLAGTPLGPRFGLPGPAPLPPKPVAPVYRPPPPPAGYRPPTHGYGGPPPRPPPSYSPPRPIPHPEPEPRPYPEPEPHPEPLH